MHPVSYCASHILIAASSSSLAVMSQQTCSCADLNCFHGGCACFTNEGVCSKDCKCRAKCKNILDNEETVTEKFAEHTKNKAPAAQTLPSGSVVAVLVPDTRAKPFPARKPGSMLRCSCPTSQCENGNCRCNRAGLPCCDLCKCNDCRNRGKLQDLFPGSGIKEEVPASGPTVTTRGKAQAVKESAVGCKCQTECASRCGCVRRKIKCTSKCKCQVCGNDDGSRFSNMSKAGAGGQGSTRSSSSAVESTGKRPKRV
uniref:CRC domain-containing protein n=1 Tax=Aegilops tauschii subsp. strangulata TaxID=200361 RepID=A0A453A2B7_AEGTS